MKRPAIVLCALLAAPAAAQTPMSQRYSSFGIDFEQDSTFLPKTDEDYTQGTELVFGGWGTRRAPLLRYGFDGLVFLDKGLDALEAKLARTPFRRSCDERASLHSPASPVCLPEGGETVYLVHEFTFGGSGYTPRKGYPEKEGP